MHMYADDTQLYLCLDPKDDHMDDYLKKLEHCVSHITLWMDQNFLKLNKDKTEYILLNQKGTFTCEQTSLKLGNCVIKPTDTVRNLGVVFDKHMTMETHVNATCKAAYYNLYRISKIRKYLSEKSTKTLVHALVISKLDYANSLLYGVSSNVLRKLQRVQNMAARLVTKTKKREHITPALMRLHWLPVKERIFYKVLLTVYKCLHGCAPEYLQDIVTLHVPKRSLRSGTQRLLVKPQSKLKVGDRRFAVSGPELWNNLPLELRLISSISAFKSQLKTHLFKKAYYL